VDQGYSRRKKKRERREGTRNRVRVQGGGYLASLSLCDSALCVLSIVKGVEEEVVGKALEHI
jgi:hypothetical protein